MNYELLKALGGEAKASSPANFGKAFRQAAAQYNEMISIAQALEKAGRPMRVMEICMALPGVFYHPDWIRTRHAANDYACCEISKCTHRLRLMRRAGLVIRTEVEGEPIEVENAWYFGGPENPGTHVVEHPKIALYSLPSLD